MSFNILMCFNKAPDNQLVKKVGDDVTVLETLTGELKEGASLIDPVILIDGTVASFGKSNYMMIERFGRSYYIKNIRSVRSNLIEISAHVDVLNSFATEIVENVAIIKRNQYPDKMNLYMNDGFFKIQQNPHVVMYEFPNGFTTQEFVLAMAGS